MAILQWHDYVRTGDAKIDREHREILTLINRLGEAIELSRWERARVVGLRLFIEVCMHFADEEALMAKHGYPELGAHRALHQEAEDYMGKLDALLSRADVFGEEVASAFSRFSARFDRDFFNADLKLASYITNRQAAT